MSKKFLKTGFERIEKSLYLLQNSYKATMTLTTKDTSIKLMLVKGLQKIHSELLFLPDRVKISKCEKPVCKMHDKEKLLAIEMNQSNVKVNKPVYLGLWILDINKIVMYDD